MLSAVRLFQLGACLIAFSGVPASHAQMLDAPFPLQVGATAKVAGTNLRLTFAGVEQDSRCPEDVTCIVAGEAVIVLEARSCEARARLTFKVPPRGQDTLQFETFSLTITEVEPKPESTRPLEYSRYVVKVLVSEAVD